MNARPGHAAGPLAGLRVLDLTRRAPGPFATMLLGDLGAEVITVEPPPSADHAGGLDTIAAYGSRRAREAGINPLFRSRRSIVVDLKRPAGREVVLRLADAADVFIEGFRPGTCARLGLGYEALAARRPELVYCSLTGYGQRGRDALRAGHDLNYLAESGMLAITTRPGQRPAIPLNVVSDFAAGGLVAAFGILAAVIRQRAGGGGGYVDVAMRDGLSSMLASVPAWSAVGADDPSWGRGLLSGGCPYYDCYQTADHRWLSVAALEPEFFSALCDAIGRPDLVPLHARPSEWPALRTAFEQEFGTRTLTEWCERFRDIDAAVAPVRSVGEAFELARREGRVDGLCTVGPLPRVSGCAPASRLTAVARPGQHSEEVLRELGYDADEIRTLIAQGEVGT